MANRFFAACSFFTHHFAKNAFTYFYAKCSEHPHLGGDCVYYNLNEQTTEFLSIARDILIQTNQKEYVHKNMGVDASSKTVPHPP